MAKEPPYAGDPLAMLAKNYSVAESIRFRQVY